jgi:hypothetical protein
MSIEMYKEEELLRLWKKWTEKKQRLESYKFLNPTMEENRLERIKTCVKRLDEINEEIGRQR